MLLETQDLVTIPQASEILECTVQNVRYHIGRGHLHSVDIAGCAFILRQELRTFRGDIATNPRPKLYASNFEKNQPGSGGSHLQVERPPAEQSGKVLQHVRL